MYYIYLGTFPLNQHTVIVEDRDAETKFQTWEGGTPPPPKGGEVVLAEPNFLGGRGEG